MLAIITVAVSIFCLFSPNGLELITLLVLTDFIILAAYEDARRNDSEGKDLASRIENLEKSTYNLFNGLTKKENKGELTEWLEKF